MAAPLLTAAITWTGYEGAVVTVFREALRRLAHSTQLPRSEEPINLELYWLVRRIHHEQMRVSPATTLPFALLFDAASQPVPDDVARSSRLRKRPDFTCVLTNPQAQDFRHSQVVYHFECKRLGQAEGSWVLNENYAEHGITRFAHTDWQYAKGCGSASMIGYLQNMPPADVLAEVNAAATARGYPTLSLAAAAWAARGVVSLNQGALARPFAPSPFVLGHLWVDLSQSQFVTTVTPPAAASGPPAPQMPMTAGKKPRRSRTKALPKRSGRKKGSA